MKSKTYEIWLCDIIILLTSNSNSFGVVKFVPLVDFINGNFVIESSIFCAKNIKI